MSISVLILTLNEELNLNQCLQSVSWCDDIVILDSYSTDNTQRLAQQENIRFLQRHFDNYASQRNFALTKISFKYPWLLMVDADEIVTAELKMEMLKKIEQADENLCLIRMKRKDFFFGKWLKHSSGYPTWFGRLMKIQRVHVARAINEEYQTDGDIDYVESHLFHYPFNKGFEAWFEKHNRYSTLEAKEKLAILNTKIKFQDFLTRDPVIRRKAIKQLAFKLPCRPLIMFLGLYFWRRGFLDGIPGLRFCILRSIYEYMIDCKAKEYNYKSKGQPI